MTHTVQPSDLTTLAQVKAWLNIPVINTTDDDLLQRLITSSSNFIQSFINRKFAINSYTETVNGKDTFAQVVSNYPIVSISTLQINGQEIPVNLTGNGLMNGYMTDGYFIYLTGYKFTKGLQNVKYSYTAGYATIPTEIEQACIELISLKYRGRQRIGEVSKTIGGETVSYSQKDMPDEVRTILNNYKKVVPF